MNSRWLGGTLTNWQTISNSIKRLRELETMLDGDGAGGLTKKEILNLTREREKLERALGGIKEMGGVPEMMFVVDTNKDRLQSLRPRHWVFRWLPFWTAIATRTVLIIRYRAMMMRPAPLSFIAI